MEKIRTLKLPDLWGFFLSVLKKGKRFFVPDQDVVCLDTEVNRGISYLYSLIAWMPNGEKVVINDGMEMIW